MKNHFLMDQQVEGRPLLVKSGVEYTQLAVEMVPGIEGRSHLVLYLGTGEYWLKPGVGSQPLEIILSFQPDIFLAFTVCLGVQASPSG